MNRRRHSKTRTNRHDAAPRRRIVLNVRLLVASTVIIGLTLAFGFVIYRYQYGKLADAFLQRASSALADSEWSKAAAYFEKVLSMRPNDSETLRGWAESLSKGADSPAKRARLKTVLYRVLGRQPSNDIRLKLAENLYALGDYAAAIIEAQEVFKAVEHRSAAQRIIALSLYASSRESGTRVTHEQAATALKSAVEAIPSDVDLAVTTATLMRTQPSAFTLTASEASKAADVVINRMIELNPSNVEALLARYQYRESFKLPKAKSDLDAAVEVSPTHYVALLLSANAALQSDNDRAQGDHSGLEKAEEHVKTAIRTNQADPRGYLLLARLLERQGRADQAIGTLTEGFEVAAAGKLDLALAKASLLTRSRRLAEARQFLPTVVQLSDDQVAQLSSAVRMQVQNQIRLLESQLDITNGQAARSVTRLKAVLAASDTNHDHQLTAVYVQAKSLLASAIAALGRPETAGQHWEELALSVHRTGEAETSDIIRFRADAHLNAARCYGGAKQYDAAIKNLDLYVELVGLNAPACIELVKMHLRNQLQRPGNNRNWEEFRHLLDQGKTLAADSFEMLLAEVEYLLATELSSDAEPSGSAAATSKAIALVRSGEAKFSKVAPFWRAAAVAYDRLKQNADVERAIQQYEQLEVSALQRGSFRAVMLARQKKWDEADAVLSNLIRKVSGKDRRHIELYRAQLKVTAGDLPAADALVAAQLERFQQDVEFLKLGIDIALARGAVAQAERLEQSLRAQAGDDDYEYRYLRAKRMLSIVNSLTNDQRQDLSRDLTLLRTERPRWHPIILLAGRYAYHVGDHAQALRDIRRAIELGDESPETLQLAIDLLTRSGEFSEAEKYLSQLAASREDDVELEAVAIDLAIRQHALDRALVTAKSTVERHPSDSVRRLRLANTLSLSKRQQEADLEFERASQDFPDDIAVWSNWIAHLFRSGQADRARVVIASLLKQDAIPSGQRHFVAGQAYEQLRDYELALAEFKEATAAEPANTAHRLRLVKAMLTARMDVSTARAELENILKREPGNAEARRQLATILASSGQNADWERVETLLQPEGDAEPIYDDRLRAMLLTRRSGNAQERRTNLESARKILNVNLSRQRSSDADIDRMLLGEVYQLEADLLGDNKPLEAGRDVLRPLVDRTSPAKASLLHYVKYLLRAVDSSGVIALPDEERAKLRGLFLADAEQRVRELTTRTKDNEAEAVSALALQLAIFKARGRSDEAARLLNEFVTKHEGKSYSDAERAQFYLNIGNLFSTLDRHSEAQTWYKKLMAVAPQSYVMLVNALAAEGKVDDAIDVCLTISETNPQGNAGLVLAQLLATRDYRGSKFGAAESIINADLKKNDKDLQLLLAKAVLHVKKNENAEAVDLFRRVLELAPNHTLALNNLATLLGEQAEHRAEAQQFVDRAIAIAGRTAPLLDTQGTIFLLNGNVQQAIASLEEAVALSVGDARYYFHLAAAYQMAGRQADARKAYDKAVSRGLDRSLLTGSDQRMLSDLEDSLKLASVN